jgi:transcription antitermination factor NusG
MTELFWAACYTGVGTERKARAGIEALGRGTILATFAKSTRCKDHERPLLSRYLLVALHGSQDHIWSIINDVDGVDRVLVNNGKPSRVTEPEVAEVMMAHATGAFNSVQARSSGGRFGKKRRRRARPRAGKKARNPTYIIGANQHANRHAS